MPGVRNRMASVGVILRSSRPTTHLHRRVNPQPVASSSVRKKFDRATL
ncbi:MAG: hypothetical protein ABIZ04_03705 [Opitutus sp.]